MAIPSLAMIPSGYKDGKVYSVLPTNGDGDFDFSRGSNATRVNKDGLIETVTGDTPRLDYTDSSCPSLLLESQSTNLIEYSEDFSDSSWIKNGALTVTSNASTSPSGETNATLLYSTTSENRIGRNVSVVNGNTYTLSVYLKNNGGNSTINFEVIGYSSKSITITNEWARYDFTITATSTSTVQFRFLSFSSNVNLHIYGAQIEEGSYATSYIPTSGSAVTRLADSCNNGGNEQVINSTEGVLYAQISTFSTSGSAGLISLSDATISNRVTIELDGANIKVRFIVGGSSIGIFNYAANITDISKIAAKFSENDFALWVNGTERVAITSGSIFSTNTLSELSFDRGDDGEDFYGNVKDVRVYNTRLTDAELAALTQV